MEKPLVLRMLHTQNTWFPFITYVKTGAGLRGVTSLTTACLPPLSYVENSSLLSLWFGTSPLICVISGLFSKIQREPCQAGRGRASQQSTFTCQAASLPHQVISFPLSSCTAAKEETSSSWPWEKSARSWHGLGITY